MTLEERLIALAQAVGADVKALKVADGNLSALSTTNKTNLVSAINEIVVSLGNAGASINDTAGAGNTLNTWSANQIYTAIEDAKTAVSNSLTNGAATALDTLSELATALGNDPAFAATLATQIGNRVRYDAAQTLTTPQQTQALANIGAVSALSVGNADRDIVATYVAAKL
jgi:hypothetical protein